VSPHDGDVPFEDDPTGMRALLSSLPDPGPMPDDLVARIQASLLSESRSRAADAQTPHAIPQPPVAPNRHGASIPASRKRPVGQWIFGLAAAGVVVAGGGYALRGAAGGSDAAGGAVSMGSAEAGSHSTPTSFAEGDASSSTKAASDDATVQGTVQVDGGGPAYSVAGLSDAADRVVRHHHRLRPRRLHGGRLRRARQPRAARLRGVRDRGRRPDEHHRGRELPRLPRDRHHGSGSDGRTCGPRPSASVPRSSPTT
jgi:hypothetical protein